MTVLRDVTVGGGRALGLHADEAYLFEGGAYVSTIGCVRGCSSLAGSEHTQKQLFLVGGLGMANEPGWSCIDGGLPAPKRNMLVNSRQGVLCHSINKHISVSAGAVNRIGIVTLSSDLRSSKQQFLS